MIEFTRRALLTFVLVSPLACKRASSINDRCPHCGMRIDPKNAFTTELVSGSDRKLFDTPRCALKVLRSGAAAGTTMRVQEFYTRDSVDASSVHFVAGSDVAGPMGAELVPVAPDKVEKFKHDHHGARVYRLEEITAEVLGKEGAP